MNILHITHCPVSCLPLCSKQRIVELRTITVVEYITIVRNATFTHFVKSRRTHGEATCSLCLYRGMVGLGQEK